MRQGALLTYIGGTSVSGVSLAEKVRAAQDVAPEAATTLVGQALDVAAQASPTLTLLRFPVELASVQVTVGDVTAVGGFCVVVAQFGWNVYKDWRALRDQNTQGDL